MPALPWTIIRTPDPARTYTAFATTLPLPRPDVPRWRDVKTRIS